MDRRTVEALGRYRERPMCAGLRLKLLMQGTGATLLRVWLFIFAVVVGSGMLSAAVVEVVFWVFPVKVVQGGVRDSLRTNVTINDKAVSEIVFAYPVGEETWIRSSYGLEWWPEDGSVVTVEYIPWSPSWSRIRGTTYSKWGVFSVGVAVIMLVLGVVALARLRQSWLQTQLLISGTLGEARLVETEWIPAGEGREPSKRLTFRFVAGGETHDFTVTTNDDASITDDLKEPILYQEGSSIRPLLVDEIKDPPELEGQSWRCPPPAQVRALLLRFFGLPVAILVVLLAFGGC